MFFHSKNEHCKTLSLLPSDVCIYRTIALYFRGEIACNPGVLEVTKKFRHTQENPQKSSFFHQNPPNFR